MANLLANQKDGAIILPETPSIVHDDLLITVYSPRVNQN